MKIHYYNVARAGQESVYGGGTQIKNIFMMLIFIINEKLYHIFLKKKHKYYVIMSVLQKY